MLPLMERELLIIFFYNFLAFPDELLGYYYSMLPYEYLYLFIFLVIFLFIFRFFSKESVRDLFEYFTPRSK